MALSQEYLQVFFINAGEDIKKHRFVGFDGNYCNADAKSLGVSLWDAKKDDMLSVAISGKVIVEAGGVINIGDPITSNIDGKAVVVADVNVSVDAGTTAVTSTLANGDITTVSGGKLPVAINGYALTSASADGDLIEVLLK